MLRLASMAPSKKRLGRPPVDPARRRNRRVSSSYTYSEYNQLRKLGEKETPSLGVGEYLRTVALRHLAAKRRRR